MQGFVAESFYGAYIKNRGDCCKYYKDKYVINRVYKTCLKNVIVGLFFNQSVVIVKIRQFCIGLSGRGGGGGFIYWQVRRVLIAQIKATR
jgi:hypothetical protein